MTEPVVGEVLLVKVTDGVVAIPSAKAAEAKTGLINNMPDTILRFITAPLAQAITPVQNGP
jgi:hypothetical protein